jgi:hypothetical protein
VSIDLVAFQLEKQGGEKYGDNSEKLTPVFGSLFPKVVACSLLNSLEWYQWYQEYVPEKRGFSVGKKQIPGDSHG